MGEQKANIPEGPKSNNTVMLKCFENEALFNIAAGFSSGESTLCWWYLLRDKDDKKLQPKQPKMMWIKQKASGLVFGFTITIRLQQPSGTRSEGMHPHDVLSD